MDGIKWKSNLKKHKLRRETFENVISGHQLLWLVDLMMRSDCKGGVGANCYTENKSYRRKNPCQLLVQLNSVVVLGRTN